MDFTFDFDAKPAPRVTKTKTGKTRGSNPPGARTRNEPPRVRYKNLPLPVHRPVGRVKEDTQELRDKIAEAAITLVDAHDAYMKALKAFGDLGPLPFTIINDMPQGLRRHLRNYRATK